MDEAKITCVCKSYAIKDLGLVMVKGDVEYVAAERARTSRDLDVAKWAKGVQVEYVRRSRTVKKKTPQIVRTPSLVTLPPPHPSLSLSEKVDNQTEEVRHLRSQLEEFQALVLSAIRDKPGAVLVAPTPAANPNPGTVVTGQDMPVFIPSGLVDHDVEVEAKVTKQKTKSQGVQDAAKALKAARKKKE